ncbi:Retrovirus-related Pol polyprotein from transposon opus [Grifola frondosa]|uniref:Retrovirus-related Pol polyprotein from transposon opus n=1 Tax=Grifola frondosa TaxID=5627 RepID=A0A1C7MIW3_GRIFR|nr:Retrovirus-related Pol polyprotein from transposon opus [Grifola frondosa]
MTEAVFAGASVGPKGVTTDLAKLTAIVDWEQPQDALNLNSFLGITGHFRDLIKGYARIEGPLRNLIREVNLPKGAAKATYRCLMADHKLQGRWGRKHTEAFLKLKTVLTSEPVLRRPKWDGTPFIVTTDGCKEGFGAVLSQCFQTVLPNGHVVQRLHPIAFASKRTSRTEEKYKPFILEFAALKFALDKFSDIVWGFPIEIETDCQALRNVLINDKLNAAHARWRDSIIAHQIIDIRHVPGKINVVADGLSRAGENTEWREGDGSTWTVSEDWESATGLLNDVLTVEDDSATLLERFKDEPLFLEVIHALTDTPTDADPAKARRAQHHASQYTIDNGKLWRTHSKTSVCTWPRVECITQAEAIRMAEQEHQTGGHWGRNSIKTVLLDRIYSPRLDQSITIGMQHCAHCKNFGTPHLDSLLNPITRRHPFKLLVGDYLSMPQGTGGYHTIGLFLDTFSQHMWAFKFKTAGSSKTTKDCLGNIFRKEVRKFCETWGMKTHVVSAYSPWINGLVKGSNKLLLHVLQWLCAPELGEDDAANGGWEALPKSWPTHLDNAIHALNHRILPALQFSPKELLLGTVINTKKTPLPDATQPLTETDVATQLAYVAQQRLDGYDAAVKHAIRRATIFNKRVLKRHPGEVIFVPGDLVQVYRNDLAFTVSTARKLTPKWSPRCVSPSE